jgi:hypothetical protein
VVKAPQELQVQLAQLALLVAKVQLVLQDLQVLLAVKDLLVLQDQQVLQVQQDHKVLQDLIQSQLYRIKTTHQQDILIYLQAQLLKGLQAQPLEWLDTTQQFLLQNVIRQLVG